MEACTLSVGDNRNQNLSSSLDESPLLACLQRKFQCSSVCQNNLKQNLLVLFFLLSSESLLLNPLIQKNLHPKVLENNFQVGLPLCSHLQYTWPQMPATLTQKPPWHSLRNKQENEASGFSLTTLSKGKSRIYPFCSLF